MNAKAWIFAIAIGLAGGQYALAHPGHKHEAKPDIDEAAVKVRANAEVARLVSKKKVPDSWKEIAVKTVEKRTYKKGWEWVAILENAEAKDNKHLYIFLKPDGAFVAANFTGK